MQSLKAIFAELQHEGIEKPLITPRFKRKAIDVHGYLKQRKHALKQAKRDKNRLLKQEQTKDEINKIGLVRYAIAKTSLAPFNTRGATTYLIKKGTPLLVIKTRFGYKAYVNYQSKTTLKEIESECQHYNVHASELNFLNKPVKLKLYGNNKTGPKKEGTQVHS